ncbi:MAG: hypothetical protein SGPRY_014899 [Prymnesium sp.]
MSDAEAAALLGRVERGEVAMSAHALDGAIAHSARRGWWRSARAAVDLLRKANASPLSETRRLVTHLRDEAGAVLNLMRQTKMDEATIHCACMWAQGAACNESESASLADESRVAGLYSVHINVKFASRLDAPVTVLNVDDEVPKSPSPLISIASSPPLRLPSSCFVSALISCVLHILNHTSVVHINSTHISFSGVGRQKPKRYVVDLQLFGPIVANESSW